VIILVFRTGEAGKPQPDNYNGLKEGKLEDVQVKRYF